MSNNKKHKKMSDLFKEKAHLLDEMPSSTSWNHISDKLRKRHKQKTILKALNIALAIAATTLIVVNLLWISGGLRDQTGSGEMVNLDSFTPSPWSVYYDQVQHKMTKVSNQRDLPNKNMASISNEYVNQRPKDVMLVSWNYMDSSPKKIDNLSAISGSWMLPSWYNIDNVESIPSSLNIFHTNDQRFYLHMNEKQNEAYLVQATDKQDKFKVLHPSISYIDNSNNTVLIVYFDNGLIVDYRKSTKNINTI